MLLFALLVLLVSNTYSETIYCTGHDAWKGKNNYKSTNREYNYSI